MFLSCSHFNVSSFALKVSATATAIRTSCELRITMFLRRRDYVFARLQVCCCIGSETCGESADGFGGGNGRRNSAENGKKLLNGDVGFNIHNIP